MKCHYCGEPIVEEETWPEDIERRTGKFGLNIGPYTIGVVKDYWVHRRCITEKVEGFLDAN